MATIKEVTGVLYAGGARRKLMGDTDIVLKVRSPLPAMAMGGYGTQEPLFGEDERLIVVTGDAMLVRMLGNAGGGLVMRNKRRFRLSGVRRPTMDEALHFGVCPNELVVDNLEYAEWR